VIERYFIILCSISHVDCRTIFSLGYEAYDASLILQYFVGIIDHFSAED